MVRNRPDSDASTDDATLETASDAGERRPGSLADGPVRGRGAGLNPTNRFETRSLHVLDEHLEQLSIERETLADGRQVATTIYRDRTRSVLNYVDSPDVGFSWTVNAYRGCEHGCVYCFARPGHEYLAMSSGLDFETKIMAKLDAPELLRKELAKPSWKGEHIMMSGVTDCYQPIEAKMGLTRKILELFVECRQAVSLITKSRLILRDLDLLQELAKHQAVSVAISITSLDNALASKMEPRASAPRDRLWAVQRLASAGIPVTVMTAPIVPALNDREIPALLKAAADAGATSAGYVMLRLPHQIKDLFDEWLDRHFPERKSHVLSLLRSARGGELYDSTWGKRLKGEGAYADQIAATFKVFAARHGLNKTPFRLNTTAFRRPVVGDQLELFG